jgi:hypothetical protein
MSVDKAKAMRTNSGGGRSFLKKEASHSGSLGFRYSAVDIEHLWNATQASKFKSIENTVGIPKGTGKEFIRSLKGSVSGRSPAKAKNRQKRP